MINKLTFCYKDVNKIKIIVFANCNSKLKQFFENIMFIEVDICKSPQQGMLYQIFK